MKFYIAARYNRREEVRLIYAILQERGHQVAFDWTVHKPIQPFDKNQELARQYSIEDIEGIRQSDVFGLLADEEGGFGSHSELGAAIIRYVEFGKPLVYILGNSKSLSNFYYHPCVRHKNDIFELLDEVKPTRLLP
jgi:hypothetical protein